MLLPNIQCLNMMRASQICLFICFHNSLFRFSGWVPKKGLVVFFSHILSPGGPPAPRNSWSMLGNLFWAIRAAPQHTMTKYEVRFSIMPSFPQHLETLGPCWGTCFGPSGLLPNIQQPSIRRASQLCLLICFDNKRHIRHSCVFLTDPCPWRSPSTWKLLVHVGKLVLGHQCCSPT